MVAEISDWYHDLDLDSLRARRPSKFLFLCGGAIEKLRTARAANLRDYLVRVRPPRSISPIVLAEEAAQLYRDTNYSDLITFEEDIARIAAIVLVIAESAGSLAELGAFTSNDIIRHNLRVVLPTRYDVEESFVRFGPVERLRNEKREFVGVYPWHEHRNSKRLNVSSAKPHYGAITRFIRSHLKKIPQSFQYRNADKDTKITYVIYWIIFLSQAISPKILYESVRGVFPHVSDKEIRNKLYCLMLARWVARESYSEKDYYYCLFDSDPFDYKYLPKVSDTSSIRRKLAVTKALRSIEKLPTHVAKLAAKSRVGS